MNGLKYLHKDQNENNNNNLVLTSDLLTPLLCIENWVLFGLRTNL